MPWPVHPNGLLGGSGSDNDAYKIERSLRFNSGDLAYLTRTIQLSGTTNTWSFWVKRSSLGSTGAIYGFTNSINTTFQIAFMDSALYGFGNTDSLIFGDDLTSPRLRLATTQVFRDTSAWYHFVVVLDTTQATDSNRAKIYVNGSQITSFAVATYPTQNASLNCGSSVSNGIGALGFANTYQFNGYLAEINVIQGQALTPSSFGETDAITGRWKAKAYSGTYGTNGFYLKFADNSSTAALGTDSSGNGNTWTPNNFSVTAGAGNDSLVDSPTNYGSDTGVGGEVRGNYCTMNPLSNNGGTVTDGNLDFYGVSSFRFAGGTIAVSSGKWYMEATKFGASTGNTESNVYTFFGFIKPSTSIAAGNSQLSYTSSVIGISDSGWAYNFAAGSSATTGFGSGDVASIAIDFTTGSYNIRKNNTSVASGTMAFTGELIPAIFSYASSNRFQPNFGQRPFAYAAPTGFKALCTTNLSTPTIKKPSSYMDVVTYTGTGSALTPTSSLGFSPDLVWLKSRSAATDHALYDAVRGAEKRLESNTTDAEVTSDSGVTAFNSNGFTLGTLAQANTNTATYVAWSWDEATIAGMNIVGYVGDGNSGRAISHSLGVTPKMIIVKNRTTVSDWPVYHSSLATNNIVFLHLTQAQAAISTLAWGGVSAASSTTFTVTVGATDIRNVNKSGDNYIAYCFAEVEGFSKFGSYTGNASADGPFIYCGFRPKLIIGKRIDAVENWIIYDTSRDSFNVASAQLQPNTSIAETTANSLIDFNSNGFKFRSTNSFNGNSAGGTHIFMAFAESPFKYARAR